MNDLSLEDALLIPKTTADWSGDEPSACNEGLACATGVRTVSDEGVVVGHL